MNMATQEGKLWMNGTMIEQPDASVHVLTHSLHYGMAVFEGVRAYQTADNRTAIFRLKEHTERLMGSAKIFQMDVPFDAAALEQAQKDVVKQNNLAEAYPRHHPPPSSAATDLAPVRASPSIAIHRPIATARIVPTDGWPRVF